MEKKQSKVDRYYDKVKYMVLGGDRFFGYSSFVLNPSVINYWAKEDESKNVWEELRARLNKELNSISNKSFYNSDRMNEKEICEAMLHIVRIRLEYLNGTYKIFTNKEKEKYITNFEHYKDYFSDKAIQSSLSKLDISSFCDIREVYNSDYYSKSGFKSYGQCKRTKWEGKGRDKREVMEYGRYYIVPSQYQTEEKIFLLNCMLYDYPYIANYDCKIYHLDEPFEFYVSTGKGDLYIPYSCLKKKSIQPAVERMESYFKSYYKEMCQDDKKYKQALNLMKSSVFKRLKHDIEGK